MTIFFRIDPSVGRATRTRHRGFSRCACAEAAGRCDSNRRSHMNRKLLWALVVVGLALVIAPLALSLPSKTAAGERMLSGFRPIMQPGQVALTAQYYNDPFVPLGRVVPMFGQMPVQMQTAFGRMLQQVQVSPTVFGQVPAGLVHYKPLVSTMQA